MSAYAFWLLAGYCCVDAVLTLTTTIETPSLEVAPQVKCDVQ